MINIENLISEATKNKTPNLGIYRLVKAEFLRWQKDNPGKNFDEPTANKILKKMADQRSESIKIYKEAGRNDLAENEEKELSYLKEILPAETPIEKIEDLTKHIIAEDFNNQVSMKNMKAILAVVQEIYPDATGKVVSQVVKSYC